MAKEPFSIVQSNKNWLSQWNDDETKLSIIPRSKSKRLAQQAKLANIDAERAIARAYHFEIDRAKAIAEAMFKSGKALRFSFSSAGRQLLLRTKAIFRKV